MKTISLKLDDSVFEETEVIIKEKGISRNQYIIEALKFYNRHNKRENLAKEFAKASKIVRDSSMKVNAEFDQLID
ncbi:MAG TPA: hypothetical protein VLA71_14400 [Algoriphagus sp.]|nr:hypothetical protein [Algoriphagus sp.]